MAATIEQQIQFLNNISPIIIKYARKYGYKNVSATIAQACLESGYGLSTLGIRYHNYFGMKCGSRWTGKSVNLRTMEEYKVGTLTAITSNFRVYSSMEEGVKGYYEFLSTNRYRKLKDISEPKEFLEELKRAGYATSSRYVDNNMRLVNDLNLRLWDKFITNSIQPVSIVPDSKKAPVYEIGKVYTLNVDLNVRTDAGKWSRKKTHEELTVNAKLNDKNKDGALDKGTKVTCQDIGYDGDNIWIKIPSGWVAAYYQGKQHIA